MTGTLSLYIARRFLTSFAMILLALMTLVFLVDFVELLRRLSDVEEFSALLGLKLALMRTPGLLEDILPFLFLFSGMICLLDMSRKLELVVARGAGVSVWGFLAAPMALALLFGIASTFLVNPAATYLKERAEQTEAALGSGARLSGDGSNIWFRQDGVDGPSIIRATSFDATAMQLLGVTAFLFEPGGAFRGKLTASSADYRPGRWTFRDARYISAEGAPEHFARYLLPTSLSAKEINETLIRPESLSIWTLNRFIDAAGRTGLNTDRFRLAFHSLLARPVLLMAMIAVAATVSLRLFRYGGVGKLALTGIGLGFLLYVMTEVVSDMGSNGILNPAFAAWAPAIVALLFGATVLLYQEDG
ncbi:LPS export ABC transporter permease LptG [Afifella pfennigii]|uniref:LPS export ABC transporter permease LptG n=1 Tax=Afifella pfennigii TaxID=209897 RepID=UPI00047C03A1|nr:LPS export ABC transporter permease LptG [Afifella pfennigii]